MKSTWEYELENRAYTERRRRELAPMIQWVRDAIGDDEQDEVGVQLLRMLEAMLPAEPSNAH